MKKLLTLLLVFLMPLCALGETWGMSLSLDAGGDALLQEMAKLLMAEGAAAADAEKEAALMQKLVDGMGIDAVMQEAAASMTLYLCTKPLIDLTVYETDKDTVLVSSLLPGYALSAPEEDGTAVNEPDWDKLAQSCNAALDAWLAGIDKTKSNGVFVGDAFDDGSKCTTWTLDDQDVSNLIDSMLTEEFRAWMTDLYTAAEMDAEAILREIDAANTRVANENSYAYVVRAVENDQEQLVGLSLTILYMGEQVATVSLGFNEENVKLVVGLGREAHNEWFELTAAGKEVEESTSCTVVLKRWEAEKDHSFAAVQGVAAPTATWEMQLADTQNAWEGSVAHNGTVVMTLNGQYDPSVNQAKGVVNIGPDMLSIHVSFGAVDAIPALDETLQVCSLTDPAHAALSEKLSNQLAAALMARLLKVLPVEQIMQLNKFTMP